MEKYNTITCKYGKRCRIKECNYTHDESELRHKSNKYKTQLCKHCFQKTNFMPIKIEQYIEDGLSINDIEKLCKCPYITLYKKDGKVCYIDKCQFAHNEDEYKGTTPYSEIRQIKKSDEIPIIETLGTGQSIQKEKNEKDEGLLPWGCFRNSPVNIHNLRRISPRVF